MKISPLITPVLVSALLCTLPSCKEKSPTSQNSNNSKPEKSLPDWKKSAELRYEVVKKLPHDSSAFLQGLEIHNGQWLESTGLVGQSSIRQVTPSTGKPSIVKNLTGNFFGEGLTELNGLVYQLTWQHQTGFIYDATTLEWKKNFTYQGEGWGLCNDGSALYLSDGSNQIRVIDPATMKTTRTINVTWKGRAVKLLNELEWIEGEIFSNIWQSDQIARIDPQTGKVISMIDFSGIDREHPRRSPDHVLNGIAYDETTGLLYVSGKCWPQIYEVRLLPK